MFQVEGKPFFCMGGQVHNSTSYNRADLERAIPALQRIQANTLAAPVMWELLEPQPGVYDFTQLQDILAVARKHSLKVVLLWFGSWKNGASHYVPEWVKLQKERFVQGPDGISVNSLSAVLEENLEADRNAFGALLQELRRLDERERTVLAVQVNNEPGILGSDRDYGQTAEALFNAPVPEEVLDWLQAGGGTAVHAAWHKHGSRRGQNWQQTFGLYAGEYFTAYHTAKYEQRLAQKGKELYPLPMYANVWLKEMHWGIPGSSYPSGGGTSNVLELWKHFAPALDCIAPDIYVNDLERYQRVIKTYARQDNPLYIPECSVGAAGALNLFLAVCEKEAVGFHAFAVDSLPEQNESAAPDCGSDFIESMRILHNAIPLLEHRQGALFPVLQRENLEYEVLDFGDYVGMIRFFSPRQGVLDPRLEWLDTFHCLARREDARKAMTRGRGLINARGNGEFFLAGTGFRLLLVPQSDIRQMLSSTSANEWMQTRQWNYLSVEEGYLDRDMGWHCTRRRNGDETDHGAWVTQDVGIVRVRMNQSALQKA